MNDKDRDLIAQVLRAAGTAGEKGFAYLVHYQFIDGIVSLAGFGTLLAATIWAMLRLLKWKPEDSDADPFRGIGIVICCGLFIGFVFGFFSGITSALAPEGAAIHSVLSK